MANRKGKEHGRGQEIACVNLEQAICNQEKKPNKQSKQKAAEAQKEYKKWLLEIASRSRRFRVESYGTPGEFRNVTVKPSGNPDDPVVLTCDCPGFSERGKCKHSSTVLKTLRADSRITIGTIVYDREERFYKLEGEVLSAGQRTKKVQTTN